MRTKQIIPGLSNTHKFRAIVNGVGFYTTPKQMVDELAARGRGAVLITFEFAEVEDFEKLSGVGFVMDFSEDEMSERDARMVMMTVGYEMTQQEIAYNKRLLGE